MTETNSTCWRCSHSNALQKYICIQIPPNKDTVFLSFVYLLQGGASQMKRDTAGSTTNRFSRYHYLSVILNNLWTFWKYTLLLPTHGVNRQTVNVGQSWTGCFQSPLQLYVNTSPFVQCFKIGADFFMALNLNFKSLFHKYLLGLTRSRRGKSQIIWPECILLTIYTSALEIFLYVCVVLFSFARLASVSHICVAQTATH